MRRNRLTIACDWASRAFKRAAPFLWFAVSAPQLTAPAYAGMSDEDPAYKEARTLVKCSDEAASAGNCVTGAKYAVYSLAACFKQFTSDETRKIHCVSEPVTKITGQLPRAMQELLENLPMEIRKKYFPDGQGLRLKALIAAIGSATKEAEEQGYVTTDLGKSKNYAVSLLMHLGVRQAAGAKLGVYSADHPAPSFSWPSISTIADKSRKRLPDEPIEIEVRAEDNDALGEGPPSGPETGKSPKKKHRKSSLERALFNVEGCGSGHFTCSLNLGGSEMYGTLGTSVQCLNTEVCNRAGALAAENGAMIYESITAKYVSMAQADLAGQWLLLEDRYRRLREEMLRRLMAQLMAVSAAEATDCGAGLNQVRQQWQHKALGCAGVDGEGAFLSAIGSDRAKQGSEAICKASHGGDAATQAEANRRLKRDIHDLLVEKCALRYIKGFPLASAGDSRADLAEKINGHQRDLQAGACASVSGEAIDLATSRASPISLRMPLSRDEDLVDRGGSGRAVSALELLNLAGEDRLACLETSVNPRVLGLSDSTLSSVDAGKTALQSYAASDSYKKLAQMFDRACSMAGKSPPGGADPFDIHELEQLVGPYLPKWDRPELQARYDRLLACNRRDRGDGNLEESLESFETACGAFAAATALPPVAAAAGPEGVAVVAAVDVACIAPPAALAALRSSQKNKLASWRLAMGSQLSCSQTADLVREQNRLDRAVNSDLLRAAFQAGVSAIQVYGIISKAAAVQPPLSSANEAEKLLKEATAEKKGGKVLAEVDQATGAAAQELPPPSVKAPTTAQLPGPPSIEPEILIGTKREIQSAGAHLAESDFLARSGLEYPPGGKIVLEGAGAAKGRTITSLKRAVILEPVGGVTGKLVKEVQVIGEDGKVLGRIKPEPNGMIRVPIDPPTQVKLVLQDGTEVRWLSSGEPPASLRFQMRNKDIVKKGFAGGHTRAAWDKVMSQYSDLVEVTNERSVSFKIPGRDIKMTDIKYSYGTAGARKAVGNSKTLFDGPSSLADLNAFEQYMAPWVAKDLKAAARETEGVSCKVPVIDASGAPSEISVRVIRDSPTPPDLIGKIRSWYIEM